MEEDDSKIFPQRLMECLGDPNNQDAICWLPHGKAFIIHNRSLFSEKVMPKFFCRKAKYSSFTRKLNRWNFSRVSSGPELGAYHHEFFLRDKPHLAAQMFCKNARTLLALASVSEEKSKASPPPIMHTCSEDELSPLPFHARDEVIPLSNQQSENYPLEFAAKWDGCYDKPTFNDFPNMMSYGGASSLQMLEQQMNYMQPQGQQQHQQQHFMEQLSHAAAPPPPPQPVYNFMAAAQMQSNHEQFVQMQQMMQLGIQHQRTRKPTNKRANAA